MPRKDHHKKTQNKLNVKLRSDNIDLNRDEIFAKYYELENSKLNKLKTQIESLISKINRLENDKNLYQTENNKLKEELQHIASRYDDNKTELERYYNVIQRTNYVLQEVFSSNEIEDLCNKIGEICDKDFEKIAEIVEDGREQFLPLARSRRFYDTNDKEFDTNKFNF
ncbi:352_t:CDS:2 [Dentiscutata heterogama]|uniref:352_t:CDS:1 n=1 Tax=Dentiscutata heterogama TaxID=1316150 RepID=A0ACA9KFX1_9GLOM|nr:352_t:CDS:2 [Dentiscutata heterogama]